MLCSFCGSEVMKGRGILFIKRDGKSFYFCGSKCRSNFNLKREGRKKKWTDKHRAIKKTVKSKK